MLNRRPPRFALVLVAAGFALVACVRLTKGGIVHVTGGVGSPCIEMDNTCVDSECNGTWTEGPCKVATDCSGYVDVDYGEQPLGPNKRCIKGLCYQVGRCSTDHS